MIARKRPATARCGAAVVETSIVLSLFLLVLIGIFEFGRYLMAVHVLENAAREGARQAVVNTERLSTRDIEDVVRNKLLGQVSAPAIELYRADAATGTNLGPWTEAGLGECIAVEVTGGYVPLLPTFGILPSSVRMSARSLMRSEAN